MLYGYILLTSQHMNGKTRPMLIDKHERSHFTHIMSGTAKIGRIKVYDVAMDSGKAELSGRASIFCDTGFKLTFSVLN